MKKSCTLYHVYPGYGPIDMGKLWLGAENLSLAELAINAINTDKPYSLKLELNRVLSTRSWYFKRRGITLTLWQSNPPRGLVRLSNGIFRVRLFNLTVELWKPPF